jgi:hypothetical protein
MNSEPEFEIDVCFCGTLRIKGCRTREEAIAKAASFDRCFLMLDDRAFDGDGSFVFESEARDEQADVHLSRAFTCYGVWEEKP